MRKFTALLAGLMLAIAALASHETMSARQDTVTVALGGFLDPNGK